MGLARSRIKMIHDDPYISTANKTNILMGFEIQKQLKKDYSIVIPFYISQIWLGATYKNLYTYSFPPGHKLYFLNSILKKPEILDYVGINLYSLGTTIEKKAIEIHLFKKGNTTYLLHNSNYSKLNINVCPSIGFTLNIPESACWGDCDGAYIDTVDNSNTTEFSSSTSNFQNANLKNGDMMVKNSLSASLNAGIKIQFKNRNAKNLFFLKFMYSHGLMPILESPYERTFLSPGNGIVTGRSIYRTYGSIGLFIFHTQ